MTRTAPPRAQAPGAGILEDSDRLAAEERRRVEHNIDRIEDRLRDAPDGLHTFNPGADPEALAASPLPPAARRLWAEWDGLELAAGELRLWPVAEVTANHAAAAGDGDGESDGESRLRPGDLAMGERGGDVLVLCADPHAEGADVVLVEEDGERLPHSSSVDLLVLAVLGEVSVLYDEEGEFQEQLFGPGGELTRAAERRLLRRHLDLDPDAPLARFRLAQSLRRAGELRAAAGELRQLLRRAPEFTWGHHEQGRVSLGLGAPAEAGRSFLRAAELAAEQALQAYFLAWACLAAVELGAAPTGPEGHAPKDRRGGVALDRATLAAQVLARSPDFVRAQEAALRDALEAGDRHRADETLRLGLAVVPGHAGLLSLRPAVDELRARPDEHEDDDDAIDEVDREIAAADAQAAADDDLADRDAPHKPASGQGKQPGKKVSKKPGGSSGQAARKGGRKPPTKRR
jgi:hypothetical protein